MTTDARDKLVEAMARALYAKIYSHRSETSYDECVDRAGRDGYVAARLALEEVLDFAAVSLTAIAEQGYAVVPREASGLMLQIASCPDLDNDAVYIGPVTEGHTPLGDPINISCAATVWVAAADLARTSG